MITVGLDPGPKNFAYSVIEYNEVTKNYEILSTGLLNNVVNKIDSDLRGSLESLVVEIAALTNGGSINITAERYMSRGGLISAAEKVNIMLGCLCSKYDVSLYSAAAWKNVVNSRLKPYKRNLKDMYPRCCITPHELDSALIGLHGMEKKFNTKIITTKEGYTECMRKVEAVSLSRKRKTRNQVL